MYDDLSRNTQVNIVAVQAAAHVVAEIFSQEPNVNVSYAALSDQATAQLKKSAKEIADFIMSNRNGA